MFLLKNKLNKEECLKKLAAENFSRVTLSFYRYVNIENTRNFRDQLFREWSGIGVLGRVYVSIEGINAQICVPEHNLGLFKENLDMHPQLKAMYLNIAVGQSHSFHKLCIKVKDVILADGIPDGEYDLKNRGRHLNAQEYNDAIEPDVKSLVLTFKRRDLAM